MLNESVGRLLTLCYVPMKMPRITGDHKVDGATQDGDGGRFERLKISTAESDSSLYVFAASPHT